MTPYKITYTKRFRKHYQKLDSKEKKMIKTKIEMLTKNPHHLSLRTKKIKGTSDLFEFSVNMNIRVIWSYEDRSLIILLDVGYHDILNKY